MLIEMMYKMHNISSPMLRYFLEVSYGRHIYIRFRITYDKLCLEGFTFLRLFSHITPMVPDLGKIISTVIN